MKEKFWYKSAYYTIVVGVCGLSLAIIPCALALLCNSTEIGVASAILLIFVFLLATYISARVPCSYTAGEDSVMFHIHWRKLELRYDDIVSMEVTQEFVDTLMLRERPYFLEYLVVKTKNEEFKFTEKVYAPPLTPRFDMVLQDGKFEKLKKFVAGKKSR